MPDPDSTHLTRKPKLGSQSVSYHDGRKSSGHGSGSSADSRKEGGHGCSIPDMLLSTTSLSVSPATVQVGTLPQSGSMKKCARAQSLVA